MRYSDEDLRRMKVRRRELVAEYGDKGQHHPMGRMIGGLNPAAQELHVLRGKIAEAEHERRGPAPILTELPGSRRGYGLKFAIEYQGRRGKLGTDNFGRWYIIVGEGSEANIAASDFKTKSEAAKAFARLSGATREGATRHHATKKSPSQLQREIDEVLAQAGPTHPRSTHATKQKRYRLVIASPTGRYSERDFTATKKQALDEARRELEYGATYVRLDSDVDFLRGTYKQVAEFRK